MCQGEGVPGNIKHSFSGKCLAAAACSSCRHADLDHPQQTRRRNKSGDRRRERDMDRGAAQGVGGREEGGREVVVREIHASLEYGHCPYSMQNNQQTYIFREDSEKVTEEECHQYHTGNNG